MAAPLITLLLAICFTAAHGQGIVKEMNSEGFARIGGSMKLEVILAQSGETRGSWTNNGLPLTNSNKYLIQVDGIIQRLTIQNLVGMDSGLYFYNLLGETSTGIFIAANDAGAIWITRELQDTVVNIGQSITLAIEVSQTNLPQGQWYKEGAPLTAGFTSGVTGIQHWMNIPSAQASNGGLYTYQVNGMVSSARVTLAGQLPTNGVWSSWGPYIGLDCIEIATCGIGVTRQLTARRTCTNPAPANGGSQCVGLTVDTRTEVCVLPSCLGIPTAIFLAQGLVAIEGTTITLQVDAISTTDLGIWMLNSNIIANTARTTYGAINVRYHTLTITNVLQSDEGNYQYFVLGPVGIVSGSLRVDAPIPVSGGWSDWSAFTGLSCTQVASCGRNIERTVTATRVCNNPTPANGGAYCVGLPTNMSTEVCELPSCLGDNLCDLAVLWNGVGYRYDPWRCDRYIQCYLLPDNAILAVHRECPFSYYWDQSIFECRPAYSVQCPNEKCSATCRFSRKKEGSCRSHWRCTDNGPQASCCERSYVFVEGEGCKFDITCQDDCGMYYADICTKQPLWGGSSTSYRLRAGGLGWLDMNCIVGSNFDLLTCDCIPAITATCSPTNWANFDTTPGAWLSSQNVVFNGGMALLNVNSDFKSEISLSAANGPRVIRFTYRENEPRAGRRVLLSNSDCNLNNSLVVTQDDTAIRFMLQTLWTTTTMSVSTLGMKFDDWKTITMMYDNGRFTVVVKSGKLTYVNWITAAGISVMKCGLRIGSDGFSNLDTNFVGSFDSIGLYQCIPEDFYNQ